MKALTFSSFGTSEVLEYIDVKDPVLKTGEILVATKAIGLNFADIYRRKGNYHLKGAPPYIAGYEGAGIVVDNNGLPGINNGDRIAFADVPFANAELVAVPATHAIPLPGDISFEIAAAVMLQGLTAQYLATDSHKTLPGEKVLIHAVAGGVGLLLTQISKLLGATVIGLTSSPAKRDIALAQGADTVLLYNDNWKQTLLGQYPEGVDVVYDSIGSTLDDSFEVTRTCGQVVFFGMAGGNPPQVNPLMLMDTSKTITGGDLWNYLTSRDERIKRSTQLFDWIRNSQVIISPPAKFHLSEGQQAHDYLESRQSTGKILLIP